MFDKSRWRLGSENGALLRRFEPKPYRYTRSAMYHNKAGRGYKPSERRAFRRARHRRKGGVKSAKDKTRQNGRRMKEPDEPMFTLTTVDRHGVEYSGRVRRLMPIECFRLQGYTDEQFNKLVEIGIPESQLYKMAGNSVTTNVVTAVGLKLLAEIQKLEDCS